MKTQRFILAASVVLAISCSSGDEESSPKDKCEKAQYNPQTQFCFDGNVSDKGEFTDARDGKKYRYVEIGTQTWMAENLNFSNNGAIGKCYDNIEANCDKYGRFYFWNTAINVCPDGWHLPNDAEWQTLVAFAGGKEIAGKKLKTRDGWEKDYMNKLELGTDDYGFSALANGLGSSSLKIEEYPSALANISYNLDFNFSTVSHIGNWWSSTEVDFVSGNRVYIYNSYDQIYTDGRSGKLNLFAVRCVKN